jgi:PTS system mannose-specific IIA component
LGSFRIVLAGHGELAEALRATTEMIVGPVPGMCSLGLEADESPDHFADRMRAALSHDSTPVLVLADLLGGTPFNVAAAIARRSSRVVCLAGVNLGMAVEAALAEGELDDALVERLTEAGRAGIVDIERHRARRAS